MENYFNEVLNSHDNPEDDPRLSQFREEIKELVSQIKKRFGSKIQRIDNSGSMEKGTDINIKSDFDLLVVFKKDCGWKEIDLYQHVFRFVKAHYPSDYVRQQSVSIGVLLRRPAPGTTTSGHCDEYADLAEFKIDVVPALEVDIPKIQFGKDEKGEVIYAEDKFGEDINKEWVNLFVNGSYSNDLLPGVVLTNIRIHINQMQQPGAAEARKLVKLLKIFVYHQNFNVSSFFLELLVLKYLKETFEMEVKVAPEGEEASKGKEASIGKIELPPIHILFFELLHHIQENILESGNEIICLDPSNPENNVSNSMTYGQKLELAFSIRKWLDLVKLNEEAIRSMLPYATISAFPARINPRQEHIGLRLPANTYANQKIEEYLIVVDENLSTEAEEQQAKREKEVETFLRDFINSQTQGVLSKNPLEVRGAGKFGLDIKVEREFDAWLEINEDPQVLKQVLVELAACPQSAEQKVRAFQTHVQIEWKKEETQFKVSLFPYVSNESGRRILWNQFAGREIATLPRDELPTAMTADFKTIMRLLRLFSFRFGGIISVRSLFHILQRDWLEIQSRALSLQEIMVDTLQKFTEEIKLRPDTNPIDGGLDWAMNIQFWEARASNLVIDQFLFFWNTQSAEEQFKLIRKYFPYESKKIYQNER